MKTLSISGKNWILRKYNQNELLYLKENFSLDEIRNILRSQGIMLEDGVAETKWRRS